jgi:hypothetical protein
MTGVGGTSPKTKVQKIVWCSVLVIVGLFVAYVLFKNRHNF